MSLDIPSVEAKAPVAVPTLPSDPIPARAIIKGNFFDKAIDGRRLRRASMTDDEPERIPLDIPTRTMGKRRNGSRIAASAEAQRA